MVTTNDLRDDEREALLTLADGGRPTVRCPVAINCIGLAWATDDEAPELDYSEPEVGRCAILPPRMTAEAERQS